MGKVYTGLDERLRQFISAQPVFFVATAPSGDGGHVNVSPKGYRGTFAILGPVTVAYLDLTGSGAETIAHLRQNGRITIMFCSFGCSRLQLGVMRIALINSGLGLLAAAAALRRMRPDADLVLAMDPDGMPWGPRQPDDIAKRSLACARAAVNYDLDGLVFACNTGSVHALGVLRQEFEPGLPVVGTVPAIKPAAAGGQPAAIWATAATTGSAYQHGLIARFAAGVPVTEVACPGLADAIHAGDEAGIRRAVAGAAAQTPPATRAIVLGCTEYELAADWIASALPGVTLFGSAAAVAAQALRRAATAGVGHGRVHVLLSGRPGSLPAAAFRYPEGRLLAGLPSGQPAEHTAPATR